MNINDHLENAKKAQEKRRLLGLDQKTLGEIAKQSKRIQDSLLVKNPRMFAAVDVITRIPYENLRKAIMDMQEGFRLACAKSQATSLVNDFIKVATSVALELPKDLSSKAKESLIEDLSSDGN